MSRTFHMLRSAELELETAHAWYEAHRPGLGLEFLLAFLRALELIHRLPDHGPIASHGTRKVLLQRFPYSIFYRPGHDEVLIVGVVHGRRRPNYWVSRIQEKGVAYPAQDLGSLAEAA